MQEARRRVAPLVDICFDYRGWNLWSGSGKESGQTRSILGEVVTFLYNKSTRSWSRTTSHHSSRQCWISARSAPAHLSAWWSQPTAWIQDGTGRTQRKRLLAHQDGTGRTQRQTPSPVKMSEPPPKKARANASSVHSEFSRVWIVIKGKRVLSSKCKHCDADPLCGVNPSNLKRHLQSAHTQVYDKVKGMSSLLRNCSII